MGKCVEDMSCNAWHIKGTNNIELKVSNQLNKYLFECPLRALH